MPLLGLMLLNAHRPPHLFTFSLASSRTQLDVYSSKTSIGFMYPLTIDMHCFGGTAGLDLLCKLHRAALRSEQVSKVIYML